MTLLVFSRDVLSTTLQACGAGPRQSRIHVAAAASSSSLGRDRDSPLPCLPPKRPRLPLSTSLLHNSLSLLPHPLTPLHTLPTARARQHRGQAHRGIRSIWLDNRAEVQVEVPVEVAFRFWEDRESIPKWMPWIASVKVQKDRPELSTWTLRWAAFGQDIELNWVARNLKPVPNQKVHWRSEDGLPNRGAVRFFKRSPTSCTVEMTISYEVPDVLLPFAAAVGPLVEAIIKGDLERFAVYAKKIQSTTV